MEVSPKIYKRRMLITIIIVELIVVIAILSVFAVVDTVDPPRPFIEKILDNILIIVVAILTVGAVGFAYIKWPPINRKKSENQKS